MNSLPRELAQKIHDFCEAKSHTLATLSKESGVPYGSVKRIAQGDTIPEFYNALKLLMVLCPLGDECFDFLSRHYGDVGDFLSRVNYRPGSSSLAEALTDKVSFLIIHLAATRGVSRAEVAQEFGRHGLEMLENLLEKGLLREENQTIVCEDFSYPNVEVTLKQIGFLLEDFDATQLGNKKSLLSLQIIGLNDAGVGQVYDALRALIETVCQIKDADELKGRRVIYLATMLNALGGT